MEGKRNIGRMETERKRKDKERRRCMRRRYGEIEGEVGKRGDQVNGEIRDREKKWEMERKTE